MRNGHLRYGHRADPRGSGIQAVHRLRGCAGKPRPHRAGRFSGACVPGGHLRGCHGRRAARGPGHRRRHVRYARPAGRRASGVQGQHEHDGHAHHLLLPHAGKLRVPVHRNVRAAHHRRRRSAAGQAEHGRVRVRLHHRVLRVRPHAQPVGSGPRPWRQLGRLCGGCRCGHGVRHAGLRHGRLHPPARQLLRHRGSEAHVRHGQPLRRRGLRQLARPGRPVRPQRRGRRCRDGRPVRP